MLYGKSISSSININVLVIVVVYLSNLVLISSRARLWVIPKRRVERKYKTLLAVTET